MNNEFLCGYVALIGKPNTGKSTLMNALVGEKLSITAHRPQTTRHQILGIKTSDDYQCIFVDTPGIHDSRKKAIHRYMNRAATSMLDDVELICVLVDITAYNQDDEKILRRVSAYSNVLVVLNKIDQGGREASLPIMQKVAQQGFDFESIPVSALTGDNLDRLMELILARLPPGLPLDAFYQCRNNPRETVSCAQTGATLLDYRQHRPLHRRRGHHAYIGDHLGRTKIAEGDRHWQEWQPVEKGRNARAQ